MSQGFQVEPGHFERGWWRAGCAYGCVGSRETPCSVDEGQVVWMPGPMGQVTCVQHAPEEALRELREMRVWALHCDCADGYVGLFKAGGVVLIGSWADTEVLYRRYAPYFPKNRYEVVLYDGTRVHGTKPGVEDRGGSVPQRLGGPTVEVKVGGVTSPGSVSIRPYQRQAAAIAAAVVSGKVYSTPDSPKTPSGWSKYLEDYLDTEICLSFSSVEDLARAVFESTPAVRQDALRRAEADMVTGEHRSTDLEKRELARVLDVMWTKTKPSEREAAVALAKAIWDARGPK